MGKLKIRNVVPLVIIGGLLVFFAPSATSWISKNPIILVFGLLLLMMMFMGKR